MTRRFSLFLATALLAMIIGSVGCSFAAEVLFVRDSRSSGSLAKQVDVASKFYGLDLNEVLLTKGMKPQGVLRNLHRGKVTAVVLDAQNLSWLSTRYEAELFLSSLPLKVPVLIAGMPPQPRSAVLKALSSSLIDSAVSLIGPSKARFSSSHELKRMTHQLTGQTVPMPVRDAVYFTTQDGLKSHTLVELLPRGGLRPRPIFVKTMSKGREVFLLGRLGIAEDMAVNEDYRRAAIWEMLPLLMFLRHACGDQCWQPPGYYANFTIDDPWLIEPYGHLSYAGLLKQMREANFHTTIAFIPWNYDRSHTDVIELFRDNPNRFSIAIHGNNHDRKEFYVGQTPAVQREKIRQALARMEYFTKATGIPYDRVMVFPRGFVPDSIFPVLKEENFLATANFRNKPQGADEPTDLLFFMRPWSLRFHNFLSIKRYDANTVKEADIALQLYLGNPLIFYSHHDFFLHGIEAFNKVAEITNRIEPTIRWVSLGQLTHKLYLQRRLESEHYEVIALSPRIALENPSVRALTTFTVQRAEDYLLPGQSVSAEAVASGYKRTLEEWPMTLRLRPRDVKVISVLYSGAPTHNSASIEKDGWSVFLQRSLADFRDLTLARYVLGRGLVVFYSYLQTLGLKIVLSGFLIISGGFCWIWVLKRRLKRPGRS